jgi:hypothetical protein
MECCGLVWLGVVLSVIGAVTRIAFDGWRSRERWGEVLSSRAAGEGAYRGGLITERRLRGVPWTVWVSGVTGAGLGPLTGLVYAPCGLLGALVYADSDRNLAWLALVTLLVSLSGFGLAFGLYRSAQAILTCEREADVIARSVARWSVLHHATIAASHLVFVAREGAWVPVLLAAFGVAHAVLLGQAASRVRAIQAAMTDEERANLDTAQGATDLCGMIPPTRHE